MPWEEPLVAKSASFAAPDGCITTAHPTINRVPDLACSSLFVGRTRVVMNVTR